jgi:hypothetical protein
VRRWLTIAGATIALTLVPVQLGSTHDREEFNPRATLDLGQIDDRRMEMR